MYEISYVSRYVPMTGHVVRFVLADVGFIEWMMREAELMDNLKGWIAVSPGMMV